MKQIRIYTKNPIEIDALSLLRAINDLRKEHAETKKNKAPIELSKALSNINIFQNRDAERGMLTFNLLYEDENETPCIRNFPNFGLDVKSKSELAQIEGKLFLSVDITVKAGKQKWQVLEISECGKIFESGDFKIALCVTLDTTTEWGGHSAFVSTFQDTAGSMGMSSLPATLFNIETK